MGCMFCTRCGKCEVMDNKVAAGMCPKCGIVIPAGERKCPKCGAPRPLAPGAESNAASVASRHSPRGRENPAENGGNVL